MKIEFQKPGTFPRPGPIGRMARIVLGIVVLYFFIEALTNFTGFVNRFDLPAGTWWIGAALSFLILSDMVNVGFTRDWGRWPQRVFILLVLAAVMFDLWRYDGLWGPPLGLLVFLLRAYVFGHLGLSLIVAGVFAIPG